MCDRDKQKYLLIKGKHIKINQLKEMECSIRMNADHDIVNSFKLCYPTLMDANENEKRRALTVWFL